jgi:hypothetical protein
MAEAAEHSLRFLTPEDIRAMAAYFRTIPPQQGGAETAVTANPPLAKASAAFSPPPGEAQAGSLGLTLFQGACASCHEGNGEGLQHPHAALAGSRTVNDPSGANLLQVILHGSHKKTACSCPSSARPIPTRKSALANYVIDHFGGAFVDRRLRELGGGYRFTLLDAIIEDLPNTVWAYEHKQQVLFPVDARATAACRGAPTSLTSHCIAPANARCYPASCACRLI